MSLSRADVARYGPMHFLGALGAGGLAVSFFMYLMWLTPHEGSPIPTFASLTTAFQTGGLAQQALIAGSVLGIVVFAAWHVRLLVWNLRRYLAWKRTPAYQALRGGNAESQLMALPLTLAMSVNVGFVVGAVFVPGLWGVREWLFPMALVAFGAIGWLGLRIYLDFFGRVLTQGGYDCSKNNSLGQMVSVFAFSMIGVGFSAAAAMSHTMATVVIGFMGAVFFIASAILLGIVKLTLGMRAMMEHRAAGETTPTLWIIIPILTVIGIALYRLRMSLAHSFDVPVEPGSIFAFLTAVVAVQVLFALIGWAVLKRVGYFGRWVMGPERSPGAYALICPGVALFVSANFLINAGLVKIGLFAAGDPVHWLLYLPLLVLQAVTIAGFVIVNAKLMPVPHEASTAATPTGPMAKAV